MATATPAPLIRPGVEVIQEAATTTPTISTPTLAPVIIGPAFEVTNVLNTDGSINSGDLYGAYTQIGSAVAESSFPAPRGNIDELSVLSDTIRVFMQFGGKLTELHVEEGFGSAFLESEHHSSHAAIQTVVFNGGTGLALAGTVLVLAIDQPVDLDEQTNITVAFTGSGNLTSAQAASQINAAVGNTVATVVGTAPNDKVQITSPTWGSLSSVTVRQGGSANSVLQIGYSGGSAAHEERIEGSGFRAQNQNNNTTQSPWIQFYQGAYLLDGTATTFPSKAGLIDITTGNFNSAAAAAITFGPSGSVPIQVGDYVFADGVQLGGGQVSKVEPSRFRIGTINTTLSVADSNGNYTSIVYDPVTFGIYSDPNPFAPKYVYFRANNLDWALVAPTQASLLGGTAGTAATQGIVDATSAASYPLAAAGLVFHYNVTINGVLTDGTFTFTGGPYANIAAVVAAIGTNIPGVVALNDGSGKLQFKTLLTGATQNITIKADGSANASFNYSTSADTIGQGTDVTFVGLTGQILNFTLDNNPHIYSASFSTDSLVDAVHEINTVVGTTVASASGAGDAFLLLTSPLAGSASAVAVGTAASNVLTGSVVFTNASTAVTGTSTSFLTQVTPGQYVALVADGSAAFAKVASVTDNTHLVLSAAYTGAGGTGTAMVETFGAEILFGLVSPATPTPTAGSGRPFPDAYLDESSVLHIGSEIIRDQVTGNPLDQTNDPGNLYIQYKALRLDVTAMAAVAGVLNISNPTLLGSVLNPITSDNPLSLGMFMAMLNAPNFTIVGLGVDEVTAAAPFGTSDAYARAASFLESVEVYAMAPLTQDPLIHQLFVSHVVAMSAPEQAGERIVFFNEKIPVQANPAVAVSGTNANSTNTSNQMLLDTNPAQGLINAGINPALPIPVSAGVYLQFQLNGEVVNYNVSGVTGSLVNFNTTFTGTQNENGFYATAPFTATLIDAPYTLFVMGAPLYIPGSNPPVLDYSKVAVTVADANNAFGQRRAYSVFPDTIETTIQGVEQSLPGFYACAAITGMVAAQPPQQGFTNLAIAGLTGVVGTERFTKSQLDQMAGGGTYILIQDSPGASVICRHQLSTDVSTIEFRELSITKLVDFTAKFLRTGVRRYIGKNVINAQLLDTLGTTISALLSFLQQAGVLVSWTITQLVQDTSAPDTILVSVTLEVPFPCNYIQLTLVI